jgi:hypothetical protein
VQGDAFSPDTVFRAQIEGAGGAYLGDVTFSSYFESGDPVPPGELAGALRAVFQDHGLDLRHFQGAVSTELDWPQEASD